MNLGRRDGPEGGEAKGWREGRWGKMCKAGGRGVPEGEREREKPGKRGLFLF